MVKPSDLNILEMRSHSVKPIDPFKRSKNKPVYAFDTETWPDGRIAILCDGEICAKTDFLNFLTSKRFLNSYKFFYNLDFDSNALFKTILDVEQLKTLSYSNLASFNIDKYLINYIPKKCLTIKKGRKTWKYFDIMQFYGLGSLEKTYSKVMNKLYKKSLDMKGGVKKITSEVIQYCHEDVQATQELSQLFTDACQKLVKIDKFYSGATLAKQLYRANMDKSYLFKNSKIMQAAMNAYSGGRIEVLQKGFFNQAFMYDIVSAYPSAQSEIPAFGNKIRHVVNYDLDSQYGFYKINISLHDLTLSPLKYRFKNMIYYPEGVLHDIWVDKNELMLLLDFGFDFTIIEGWEDRTQTDLYPFDYMKDLFDVRKKYKKEGSSLQYPIKLALNSSYGILIERQQKFELDTVYSYEENLNPDNRFLTYQGQRCILRSKWFPGQFFHPIYACEITSRIRAKIYRDSIKYADNLIKISTDSITFDRRIKLPFGSKLGQYDDSPKFRGLVVGSGVYAFKCDEKEVLKFRSFGRDDVMALADKNPFVNKLSLTKHAPRKLKETRKNNFVGFNVFTDKVKNLDINFDKRRRWNRDALNFRDLMCNVIKSGCLEETYLGNYDCRPTPMLLDSSYVDSSLRVGENVDNYCNIRM